MGNLQCTQLNEYKDACQMAGCIKRVDGLESDSSSPTDTWIITFNDDVLYNNIPISKGFVKWFISPKTMTQDMKQLYKLTGHTIETNEALDYEIYVYRDIIRPLIDYKICPNFVRYLGSGFNCSFENVEAMLLDHIYDKNNKKSSDSQIRTNLIRNTSYIIRNTNTVRPSINDNTKYPSDINSYLQQTIKSNRYSTCVTEAINSNTEQFYSWYGIMDAGTVLLVFFQIILACYAMSMCRMTHNDLHLGNVWVETLDAEEIFHYFYGCNHYAYRSRYRIMIYDFDRSYVEILGDNSYINEKFNMEANITNSFVPNKDVMKIFAEIWPIVGNKKQYLQMLSDDEDMQKMLNNSFNYDSHQRKIDDDGNDVGLISNEEFAKCKSIGDILHSFAENINVHQKDIQPHEIPIFGTKNFFVCFPDMFDELGRIKKLSKPEEIILNLQNTIKSNNK